MVLSHNYVETEENNDNISNHSQSVNQYFSQDLQNVKKCWLVHYNVQSKKDHYQWQYTILKIRNEVFKNSKGMWQTGKWTHLNRAKHNGIVNEENLKHKSNWLPKVTVYHSAKQTYPRVRLCPEQNIVSEHMPSPAVRALSIILCF